MDKLRWIVIGVLGGATYTGLVAFTFVRTFAIAWPEWYQVVFENQSQLGVLLWEIAMGLPALLYAMLVGIILTKVVGKAALPAAFVGAAVTLTYAASSSVGSGWVSTNTFIIVGLLPLCTFVLALYNTSLTTDAGDAGTG